MQIETFGFNLHVFHKAVWMLNVRHTYVASPVDESYPLKENVTVAPPEYIIEELKRL